jgi:hypothetical protein
MRERERERERLGAVRMEVFILIPYRQNLSYVYSFLSDNS